MKIKLPHLSSSGAGNLAGLDRPMLVYAPPPTPPGGINTPPGTAKGPGQPFSGTHGLGPTQPKKQHGTWQGHAGDANPNTPNRYA